MYEKRTPDMSTWKGRRRKGDRDHHSFNAFVERSKNNKNGQAHLMRHHGGYGL